MVVETKIKYHYKRFKNTTKEERAKQLNQIICPRCKYHNEIRYVKESGTCHLCGTTLDKDFLRKDF